MVFPSLNFAKASRGGKLPPVPPEELWVTWDDGIPRTAVSADGEVLLYYLPNITPADVVVSPLSYHRWLVAEGLKIGKGK